VLSNSGHQFFINNPKGIAKLIKDDLLGNVKGRFELCKYSIRYVDNQGNETYLDEEEIAFRANLKEIEVQVEQQSSEVFEGDDDLEKAVEDFMEGE
jgi:hypothetical protein